MKIVLDSNVLLVALGKRSNYRLIWDAFIEGDFQLIISDEIIYEYEEILKLHSAPGVAEIVTEILVESPNVIFQHVYYNWNAIKSDPDDDKFFRCCSGSKRQFYCNQ
jgi:predicted nucleic acid-binding protein